MFKYMQKIYTVFLNYIVIGWYPELLFLTIVFPKSTGWNPELVFPSVFLFNSTISTRVFSNISVLWKVFQ